MHRLVSKAAVLILFAIFATPVLAQFSFLAEIDGTTIEDNADFIFYFSNSSGYDEIAIAQVLIGDSQNDTEAIFFNLRPGSTVLEVGESGHRGGFLGGGDVSDDLIINGTRVRVNYNLAQINIWDINTYRLKINLSFRNKEFEGQKYVYMRARNLNGLWTNWQQALSVTIVQSNNTSDHRPEPLSFDAYSTNPENNHLAEYTYWIRDRDGWDDIRSAHLMISKYDSYGLFGGRGPMINYISIDMDFDNGTYTVYDLERGYWRAVTRSIGASGRVNLDGASVDVIRVEQDSMNPDSIARVTVRLTFSNPWAGRYEIKGNATDYSGKFSGSKDLGQLQVGGGEFAPVPNGISPNNVKVNWESAPGERIPLQVSMYWYDPDGQNDIKKVDLKIAKNVGDTDEIFFLRFYPRTNRWRVTRNELSLDNDTSHTIRGDVPVSGIGRALGSQLQMRPQGLYNLRIDIPLLFDFDFRGPWKIYMRGEDFNKNRTNWQFMGPLHVAWSDKRPVPARNGIEFNLGIINSQFRFRDDDGPNDIETIEFAITQSNPDLLTARVATLLYDHRIDRFVIVSQNGISGAVSNISTGGQRTRHVDTIRMYFPQTRMVGLSGTVMYFFLCGQLATSVDDGLYLIYARCTNTAGNRSRWVLLSTYRHDSSVPYFRP